MTDKEITEMALIFVENLKQKTDKGDEGYKVVSIIVSLLWAGRVRLTLE